MGTSDGFLMNTHEHFDQIWKGCASIILWGSLFFFWLDSVRAHVQFSFVKVLARCSCSRTMGAPNRHNSKVGVFWCFMTVFAARDLTVAKCYSDS